MATPGGIFAGTSGDTTLNAPTVASTGGRLLTGLAAGLTTFKLTYLAGSAGITASFLNRWLIAQPL
jgi:hypothetical protein